MTDVSQQVSYYLEYVSANQIQLRTTLNKMRKVYDTTNQNIKIFLYKNLTIILCLTELNR